VNEIPNSPAEIVSRRHSPQESHFLEYRFKIV